MMYDPNAFTLNLEQMLSGVPLDTAVGVLQVIVRSARDIKGSKIGGGTPDPYVSLALNDRAELARTKCKHNTLVTVKFPMFCLALTEFQLQPNLVGNKISPRQFTTRVPRSQCQGLQRPPTGFTPGHCFFWSRRSRTRRHPRRHCTPHLEGWQRSRCTPFRGQLLSRHFPAQNK